MNVNTARVVWTMTITVTRRRHHSQECKDPRRQCFRDLWPWHLTFWIQIKWVSRTHRGTFVCRVWWSFLIGIWHIVCKNRETDKQTNRQTNADNNSTPRLLLIEACVLVCKAWREAGISSARCVKATRSCSRRTTNQSGLCGCRPSTEPRASHTSPYHRPISHRGPPIRSSPKYKEVCTRPGPKIARKSHCTQWLWGGEGLGDGSPSTGRPPGAWAGGRHFTAGQYGYVPLERHLVLKLKSELILL